MADEGREAEVEVDIENVGTSPSSSSSSSSSSGSGTTTGTSSPCGSIGRVSKGGPEVELITEEEVESRQPRPTSGPSRRDLLVGVSTHEVGSEVLIQAREEAEAPPEFDAGGEICLLSKAEFDSLRERYQIPDDVEIRMPIEGERACWSRTSELCVNIEMFKAGFQVPVPKLVVEILKYYQVAPIQLMPNSWKNLIAFIIYFRRLGQVPTLNMFRNMFTSNDYCRTGWYYFAKKPDFGDLLADKPTSIKL